MDNFDPINALISAIALGGSIWALVLTLRMRRADSFGKLYDELNATAFGLDMEQVANWVRNIPTQSVEGKRGPASTRQIYDAYWAYLDAIKADNTKKDPLEAARRTVKAWCVKCLDYQEHGDLSGKQLRTLITADRMKLLLIIATMTRAQTARWKTLAGESTKTSSDEPKFVRLEAIAQGPGYKLNPL